MLAITKYRLKAQCVITTIAGNGTQGFIGDSGVATVCELHNPTSLNFDKFGNVFVTDIANNRVRKINTSGVITTIVGTGVAGYSGDNGNGTSAELNNPINVITDDTGNIYIADYLNSCIRKVNILGIITTIAGTGTAGYNGDNISAVSAQLNLPSGLAFDAIGNLYIGDTYNYRIRKINTLGMITTIAGTVIAGYNGDNIPAISAQLNKPTFITFDKLGNLYFNDVNNNRTRKINTSGIITTMAGTGTAGYNGDNIQASLAQLNNPSGIACDILGNIYLSDQLNHRIRKIDTGGIITTIVGTGTGGYNGDNIAAITAELYYPEGLSFDSIGNLYIADNYNNRIRKVTNVGQNAGVNEFKGKSNEIKVYPNPTMNNLQVTVSYEQVQDIKIYDMLGKEIINTKEKEIDVSNLSNGVYFINIKTNTSTYTQKVVVQH